MSAATRYFEEQVLRKRPYLTIGMCRGVVADPLKREVQDDGRIRHGAGSPCQARAKRASCGS